MAIKLLTHTRTSLSITVYPLLVRWCLCYSIQCRLAFFVVVAFMHVCVIHFLFFFFVFHFHFGMCLCQIDHGIRIVSYGNGASNNQMTRFKWTFKMSISMWLDVLLLPKPLTMRKWRSVSAVRELKSTFPARCMWMRNKVGLRRQKKSGKIEMKTFNIGNVFIMWNGECAAMPHNVPYIRQCMVTVRRKFNKFCAKTFHRCSYIAFEWFIFFSSSLVFIWVPPKIFNTFLHEARLQTMSASLNHDITDGIGKWYLNVSNILFLIAHCYEMLFPLSLSFSLFLSLCRYFIHSAFSVFFTTSHITCTRPYMTTHINAGHHRTTERMFNTINYLKNSIHDLFITLVAK